MFGGVALLRGLVAALGAALFVGNAMALFRDRPTNAKTPTWQQRQQRRPPGTSGSTGNAGPSGSGKSGSGPSGSGKSGSGTSGSVAS
jgi:hypothetical protein